MSKITLGLGVACLISIVLLVNSIAKLGEYKTQLGEQRKKDTEILATPARPSPGSDRLDHEKMSRLREELQFFTQEIEQLKTENEKLRRQTSGSPSSSSGSGDSKRPGPKPETTKNIRELWKTLQDIKTNGSRMDFNEYSGKIIAETAQFLELSGSQKDQFVSAAAGLSNELKNYSDEMKGVSEPYPQGQRSWPEAVKKIQEAIEVVKQKYADVLTQRLIEYQAIQQEYQQAYKIVPQTARTNYELKQQALQARYHPILKQQQEEQQAVYATYPRTDYSEYTQSMQEQSIKLSLKLDELYKKTRDTMRPILSENHPIHKEFMEQSTTWLHYLQQSSYSSSGR